MPISSQCVRARGRGQGGRRGARQVPPSPVPDVPPQSDDRAVDYMSFCDVILCLCHLYTLLKMNTVFKKICFTLPLKKSKY
jgi:hypothetical protein